MASKPTTFVQPVTIYVAGQLVGGIDVRDDVVVFAGGVLVRFGDAKIADRLVTAWRKASLHLDRLPRLIAPAHYALDVESVGIVATVTDKHTITSAYLPLGEHGRIMPHLRIQVGPLVWLVLDQASFMTLLDRWTEAARAINGKA